MFVDCLPLLVLVYIVRYNQQQHLFSMNILFSSLLLLLEISWLAARILVHTHCQSISYCRLQITVATALSTWCGSVFGRQCLIDLLWGPYQFWALLHLLASVWEFLLRQLLTYNVCQWTETSLRYRSSSSNLDGLKCHKISSWSSWHIS